MKRFVVSWWNGDELVEASTPDEAKEIVRRTSYSYRESGRGAHLSCEEVKL